MQAVLQARGRRGTARSIVKVRRLFSALHASVLLTIGTADLSKESGQIPKFQTHYQICLRCSRARRNRALVQQWGVWLAGKDAERALKVGQCQAPFFAFALGIHLTNVRGGIPQLLTLMVPQSVDERQKMRPPHCNRSAL